MRAEEHENTGIPKVSIGMPVYNGERFLEEALDSLVAQTFEDFEIVISDNASTDRTEAIVNAYASRDRRIRYSRQAENRGYVYNFNRVFRVSRGRYFKWAAHDDVVGPDFLSDCVRVLDRDPTVVLACPRIVGIDEASNLVSLNARVGPFATPVVTPQRPDRPIEDPSSRSSDPVVRFRGMMRELWWTAELYGLIRREVLAQTPLHPNHWMGDHILLTELALHGRFYEVPKDDFFLRMHAQKTSAVTTRDQRVLLTQPKTARAPASVTLRRAWGYPDRFLKHAASIHRAPLTPRTKWRCYLELVRAVARWFISKLRKV